MKEKKTSLQEKILKLLRRERIANTDSMVVELEAEFGNDRSIKPKYVLNRTVKHMHKRGLIEVHDTDRSSFARLTKAGSHKLRSLQLSSDTNMVPTRWDGFWRFVMLDLPESRKDERDSLRYLLKKANFECLKNSVWVSPYPLEHLLHNIKEDLNLTDEIMIIVSEQIDSDLEKQLIEKFFRH